MELHLQEDQVIELLLPSVQGDFHSTQVLVGVLA